MVYLNVVISIKWRYYKYISVTQKLIRIERMKALYLLSIFVMLFFLLACKANNKIPIKTDRTDCQFSRLNTKDISFLGNDNCQEFARLVNLKLMYCSCLETKYFYSKELWDAVERNKECLDDYENSNILEYFGILDSSIESFNFRASEVCNREHNDHKIVLGIALKKDSVHLSKRISTGWHYDHQ